MKTLKNLSLTVCERFKRNALHMPLSIALSCGSSVMTYAELDRRASQFSDHLVRLGFSQGRAVAICMERSFDWIAAALGTMRIGGHYVPLDPKWSDERIRYALNDSGAAVLVAEDGTLKQLKGAHRGLDPRTVSANCIFDEQVGAAVPSINDLAYVIYTSGTTGVPKGVAITHANLANLVSWHCDTFSLSSKDHVSHLAGAGFDAAVWEIWPTLSVGAVLHLADEGSRSSSEGIKSWFLKEKISVGFVPTPLCAPLIREPWPESASLRVLLTGGDTLQQGPIAGLPFRVYNNYGPTECTVVATSALLPPDSTTTPSIGKAITGCSVYLLDDQIRPVALGQTGEIYIGGAGVGRGYIGMAEATNLAFLPDPFSFLPGARMYRTGDLGVCASDGNLSFRGRNDRQVQIRGQRVELDEIATVLSRHPSLEYATVFTLPHGGDPNTLIGYVLPRAGVLSTTEADLQAHLLQALPKYMIPSLFVELKSIPMNLNGKVDPTQFPAPTEYNRLQARTAREPQNPLEEQVLAMAKELLASDTITLDDDFFLIGGHSLIGMQLILRLRETFGIDFTLMQLFQSSTLEALAQTIEDIMVAQVQTLSDEEAYMQYVELK